MLGVMEFVNALKAMPEAGDLGDEEALEVFVEVDQDGDGLVRGAVGAAVLNTTVWRWWPPSPPAAAAAAAAVAAARAATATGAAAAATRDAAHGRCGSG